MEDQVSRRVEELRRHAQQQRDAFFKELDRLSAILDGQAQLIIAAIEERTSKWAEIRLEVDPVSEPQSDHRSGKNWQDHDPHSFCQSVIYFAVDEDGELKTCCLGTLSVAKVRPIGVSESAGEGLSFSPNYNFHEEYTDRPSAEIWNGESLADHVASFLVEVMAQLQFEGCQVVEVNSGAMAREPVSNFVAREAERHAESSGAWSVPNEVWLYCAVLAGLILGAYILDVAEI